jgi:hypothetical protein
MTITDNIPFVIGNILAKFRALDNPETVSRAAAVAVLPELKERIHVQGKKSDGNQIGTYSAAYMRIRQGIYNNSEVYKKGNKKGQLKNAGVYTDKTIKLNKQTGVFTGEDKIGTARINYNRGSDTKIIISLTRQLENSYTIVATEKGYTIGFLTPLSYKKAEKMTKNYGDIWLLTEKELELTKLVANETALLIMNK